MHDPFCPNGFRGSSPEVIPGVKYAKGAKVSEKVCIIEGDSGQSALLARMNGREPVHHGNLCARAQSERWVLHKALVGNIMHSY